MRTIATFTNPMDARLLIARLEGSGVQAHARDENMVMLESGASNALGGVKVDVADEDFEEAVAVMNAPAADEEIV